MGFFNTINNQPDDYVEISHSYVRIGKIRYGILTPHYPIMLKRAKLILELGYIEGGISIFNYGKIHCELIPNEKQLLANWILSGTDDVPRNWVHFGTDLCQEHQKQVCVHHPVVSGMMSNISSFDINYYPEIDELSIPFWMTWKDVMDGRRFGFDY